MKTHNNSQNEEQIEQCIELLQRVLKEDLLGIYLHGSSVTGGLKAFSDLDLFVLSKRETSSKEKEEIAKSLLKISGVYQKSSKRPIELIIVVKSQVNSWQYPPHFDFMYGDWLRSQFESGNKEPWLNKKMPDLAILIAQLLLNHKVLFGDSPKGLLVEVPYKDILKATEASLDELIGNIKDDTRNVLLTLARIWVFLETNTFHSKPEAALWALDKLPKRFQASLKKARLVCLGDKKDIWKSDLDCLWGTISKIERQASARKFRVLQLYF